MPTVTVSSKGQLVIPEKIRKKYNITKGTKLELIDIGDEIVLVCLSENPLKHLRGMFSTNRSVEQLTSWVKEEDKKISNRESGKHE